MERIFPALKRSLSVEEIEKMHNAAIKLVGEIGISVPHDGVRELLEKETGVRSDGPYLRFDQKLVEWAIKEQKYPDEVKNMDFTIISGAYSLNTYDLETGNLREATVEDLVNFTKLADSFGMLGSAPVRPGDIKNNELQELLHYKISWQYSSQRSNSIFEANEKSSYRVAKYVYEMSQAADKYFSLGLWIKSPFKTSYNELDIIYKFRNENIPLFVGTLPIMGMTAPIFITGAYVQSMAELFAGITLLKLLCPGSNVYCIPIDSIRVHPFDMRFASFVYGSPEDLLALTMQIELNNYYQIPVVAKSLLTTAKEPDAHAAAEKTANTLVAALAGARIFTNAGLLAVDEIYCPEQVVIDYEIVQYVKRVIKGFFFNEESLGVDIIKEVAAGNTYLEHSTTLEHYRELWDPKLFTHESLAQWQNHKEKKSIRGKAREIAIAKVKNHNYEIEDDIRKELDKIYEKAKREIMEE